ncbi:O-antigen ligase family protein [Schinkia sp. CFF1]
MDYSKYYKKSKVNSEPKIERDNSIDAKESANIDKTIYMLLIAALVLIPLFVKARVIDYASPKLTLLSTGMQADIFSYYKYIFLIIITILIGILFLYKVFFLQYTIPKNKINLFLGILSLAVTLSAVLSPYKSLALHGMYNRHEGTLAFICYIMLFFVTANMKLSAKQISGFLYSLYPFVILNMITGIAVLNGKNLLNIGWLHNFILGAIPKGAQVSEGAQLWGTLSNPNYISGIGSILAVLFLTWALFDKNKVRTAINVVMALLSFVIVLTSLSTSGFLTLLVLLPIMILAILVHKQKGKALLVLGSFLILAISIFIPIANKNPRVWDESIGFIIKENPFANQPQASLLMTKPQVIKKGLNEIFLPHHAYAEGSKIDDNVKFSIPTLPAPGIGAGTGRVYNWEKTLELVKARPLFGYGLDTFPYFFPQNDPDIIANLGTSNIIFDKPHNMFLGLLYGSGVFAFLSFMALIILIVIKQIRVYFKHEKTDNQTNTSALNWSILLLGLAYLVQGLFNDSIVAAAPIFWVLMGVLVANINQYEEVKD